MEIREEEREDWARVFEVEERAFERPNEARIVEDLRDSKDPHLSLVAVDAGEIVGHVFLSTVGFEGSGGSPRLCGLGPIGVDPTHQRSGIGSALVRAGLDRAPELGWQAVFLVGDPAYYSRFGFRLVASEGFSYGNRLIDTVLQAIELEPGILSGLKGRVVFDRAFEVHG